MKKNNLILLLVIIIVGSFLRFYKLNYQSLWLDELVTMTVVDLPTVADVLKITTDADIHPPGFYILLHYWIKTFGNTETQLKMISVIAGILSIISIYFFAKKLFSWKEGLISAAILSVAWFPIYYSQEARAYSLLLFCSMLSVMFYWEIFQKFYFDKPLKIINVIFYVLSIIVLTYIHYFGLYLVGLEGLGLLIIATYRKKYFKELIQIYLIPVLIYIPWLPLMKMQFLGDDGQHMKAPDFEQIFLFTKFIFNDSKPILLFHFLLTVVLITKISKSENWKISKILRELSIETKFVLIWCLVPLFLILLISQVKPVFSFRNMLIIYAAVPILLSRLITTSIKKDLYQLALASLIIIVLLFNLLITKGYYTTKTKEQFREATEYVVNENRNLNDAEVLAYTYAPDFFNFYFDKFNSKIKVDHFIHISFTEEKVKTEIAQCNSEYLWLIYAHDVPNETIMNSLQSKYSEIKSESFVDANTKLFKKK
ncbi:MAG: glycosyltransferase family 39 protein [Melioribacteraceae bacterium]